MTFRYFVMYRRAGGDTASAEIAVAYELDNALGRVEAQKELAARGVTDPTITGWALRRPEQETS